MSILSEEDFSGITKDFHPQNAGFLFEYDCLAIDQFSRSLDESLFKSSFANIVMPPHEWNPGKVWLPARSLSQTFPEPKPLPVEDIFDVALFELDHPELYDAEPLKMDTNAGTNAGVDPLTASCKSNYKGNIGALAKKVI